MAPSAAWPVALFVPNLIGYVRVITALAAFAFAFSRVDVFFLLYGFSYALDAADGVAARKLGQCSSFGAVLDMVTDRIATAALLAARAALALRASPNDLSYLPFIYLMILDVGSHWVQMYSSLASGAASHKALKDEHPILQFYYTFPYALFTICMFNESALVFDFVRASVAADISGTGLVAKTFSWLTVEVTIPFLLNGPMRLMDLCYYVSFPVFALKQVISLIQLGTAVGRIIDMDESARAAKGKAA